MILYKFIKLDCFEQVSDLLLTKRLYCPKPKELNDPLEGVLGITLPETPTSTVDSKPLERSLRFWSAIEKEINRYRLCSFSGNPNSLLMWSHYSNRHSGICIELDLSAYKELIEKVVYVDDLSDMNSSSAKDQLKYKLRHWEYEDEYRVILSKDTSLKYIKADIKTVLIGASIKGEFTRPLFELCRLMKYPKEFFSFSTKGTPSRFPLKTDAPWD